MVGYASAIYALDLGGLMAISAFFRRELSTEEKKLVPRELLARYRRESGILFVFAALFFLTALPQFWSLQIGGTSMRFLLWFGVLIMSWILDAMESKRKKPSRIGQ